MKSLVKTIIIHILCGLLILLNMGCTLIGLGIGAAKDASNPDYIIISVEETDLLEKDSEVTVEKIDGSVFKGLFQGFRDEKEYINLYNKNRQKLSNEIRIPAVGEISIRLAETGKRYNLLFVGFDFDGIIIKKTKITTAFKSLFKLLPKAELVDSEGNKHDLTTLENLVTSGKVPVFSALKLKAESGEIEVEFTEIVQLVVPNKKNATLNGLLYGAALDVAALVIISAILPFKFSFGTSKW